MVTRCITALNELDRVSQRISEKHSEKRFQANAEAKLKVAKKKIDQAFQEYGTSGTRTSSAHRDRVCAEWNVAKKKGSSCSPSPSKHQQNNKPKGMARSSKCAVVSPGTRQHVNSRRTKSWTNCHTENSPARCKPDSGSVIDENDIARPRPVSIYGKHTEAESKYSPTAWFNFTEETSMGTIDSFACGDSNVKALCYKVDKTQAKGMPKLLRHRMEVRVGQNGVVRKTSEIGTVASQDGVADKSPQRQGNTLNVKNDKERVAPLSWDEQMNWSNVKCISQKVSSPKDQQEKGLCETRPVIFHPRERVEEVSGYEVKSTSNSSSARAHTYRMYLETRTLSADRRNLVASPPEKLFTTIGIEDAREDREIPIKSHKEIQSVCELEETSGEDIKVESFRATHGMLRENAENTAMKDMSLDQVMSDKFSKKMSFDDEEKELSMDTKQSLENFSVAPSKKMVLTRPRTSRERLRTTRDFGECPSQPMRPCTAPQSSPSSRHCEDAEEVWHKLPLIDHHAPVIIPTSRLDSIDTENTEDDEIKAIEDENIHFCEEQVFETPNIREGESESTSEKDPKELCIKPTKLRVTFAPMSAPPRQVSQGEEPNRSKSATLHRQKAYSPPPPVVIYSQSSLELPKDSSPAHALLNLRKKIREDLEQQNQDIQLDIQQLHLTRHSGDV